MQPGWGVKLNPQQFLNLISLSADLIEIKDKREIEVLFVYTLYDYPIWVS